MGESCRVSDCIKETSLGFITVLEDRNTFGPRPTPFCSSVRVGVSKNYGVGLECVLETFSDNIAGFL